MNVVPCFAALLALQGASPPCDLTDNGCKAKHYERRAAESADLSLRAMYLHMAHRNFLALYDKTGRLEHLCAARRSYDRSVAIRSQPAEQRASFVKLLPELEAREESSDVQCPETRRRPKPHPPLPAKAATSAAPASGDPRVGETRRPPSTSAGPPEEPHPEPTPTSASPRTSVALLEPVRPPPSEPLLPVTRRSTDRRPGRPLVITGGVSLGVGLALVGVAAYSGSRALGAYREGVELRDELQGPPDDEARARHTRLETEYQAMLPLAVGTTITGAAAVIVGAVLSGVGGRRLARRRTAFVPAFGGLAFHARF